MDINTDTREKLRSVEHILQILRRGTVRLRGFFRLGSNETYLCDLSSPEGSLRAVYKPVQGERPLWDFPAGTLGKREAAAFEVSRAIGWDFVPPTVFREEAPMGPGSLQEYLELNLEQNYFWLRGQDPDALRRVAAFDVVINNADRKAMHVACDPMGGIWLIDHGVCFHTEPKLRTVIWDFAGEELPEQVHAGLGRLKRRAPELRVALSMLLHPEEILALETRTQSLESAGRYPEPGLERSIPWPILA